MYALFTDTDTDITPSMAQEYGYQLISMPYTVGDKTIYPYKDFDEFDAHAFYDSLREGNLPTTSALNAEEYKKYFEPILKKGDDILYIHFSKAMSGTFNSLNLALEDLKERYPDRTVYLFDTKGITILSLAFVVEVGKLYKQKRSIQEILAWCNREVDRFACYFFADNLKFFKKSGRVSGITASMGNLIGIKPIITMSEKGVMDSIGKERGRNKAVERLVQYVVELGDAVKDYTFIIGHADCIEIANQLLIELKEALGQDINPIIVDVNPTAGSHCGPDTVGVCFHAIHR